MTLERAEHKVSIVVDGKEVRGWTEYTITSSMLDPVDTFSMTLPWSRDAWDMLRPERPVRVTIDGITVLRGYLEDRESPPDEDTIVVSGRDLVGRLVQESAPSFAYRGLSTLQLIERLADPWFTKVTLSNARNRKVLRGKGRKAVAGDEPVRVDPRKDGLLAEPGQTRWEIIERLLDQAGWTAWSAGDGTELVVGKPNYEQEVQWRFFRPAPGSARMAEGNVSIGVKDSTGDRYSRIVVVGAGRGTTSNYGAAVAARYAEAKDNPATAEGTGGDFSEPKRLVLQLPVQSTAEAQSNADREMRRRKAQGEAITVRAPLHGQLVGGRFRTIFCPDTLGAVEDERTGRKGAYLVTSCKYTSNRANGERTDMDLVPKGTELAT
jgi:prophage tail gpP-like protein